jgi:peptidoglycan/xylan/chitin deacetylase (PgdA/CDA1 family)
MDHAANEKRLIHRPNPSPRAMPLWKQLLLETYYRGSLPYRRWQSVRAQAAGTAPLIVLFYHRIADDAGSPWTMSNREFAAQMDWLQRRFDMISLEEVQCRLVAKKNPRPAVSITFDDGYDANCDEAIPLLLARKIPCTYFVSSRCVLEGIPFPHDVGEMCLVRPNTLEQIRAMAAAGIEIGAHTRTHADIGRLHNPRELHDEVVGSGRDLQQVLGRPVRYFAFPYGQPNNMSAAAFQLAREHGYAGVCSAYGGYNFPGDDPYHLQRIYPDNMLRLKNWLTVDPRKTCHPYRYDYRSSAASERDRAPAR